MIPRTALWLLALLCTLPAQAGLLLSASRVIYPADARERHLEIVNTSPYPVLVQAWVDDGESHSATALGDSPFVALPAVLRLEPSARHTIRLLYNGQALPQDRESLFWLNLLAIPPDASQQAFGEHLTISLQTQIKLLWRPHGLGAPQQLAQQQRFSLSAAGNTLCWRNPTAHYVTLAELHLQGQAPLPGQMLAPFATNCQALTHNAPRPSRVEARLVDDRGALHEFQRPLQPDA